MLDNASRQRDFPSLAGMTYFNTAAEGIPPQAVGRALDEYFRDKLRGSAGRVEHFAAWEAARRLTGEMFGLSADEIGICSCSSEAFNLLGGALNLHDGDEVIINDLDFPSGRTPWLEPDCPASVKLWQSRDGALRIDDLVPLLGPRTRLVSTSLVSYFNGFMVNLPELLAAVRRASPALVALDVTQALGRIPLDVAGVDFIVSSTHKWILATHGGGLVGIPTARAAELTAPAGGWFNLEDPFDRRADDVSINKPGSASFMVGMPNFPAIYAIRSALEYIQSVGPAKIDAHARPLVHAVLDGLARLPVEVITPREKDAMAGIVAFRCEKMPQVFERLNAEKIQLMHSAGRLRISLHGYNTIEDVERLLSVLTDLLP